MRFVSKFYILVALAGCSILFSVRLLWMSSDYMPISPGHDPAFQVTEKRLVVFGDSWSDSASRDEEQGPLWTEWLCSMTASVFQGAYAGAVIDNAELQSFESGLSWLRRPLPDLRSQIDQWSAAEQDFLRKEGLSGEAIQERQSNTIFAVSFMVWDLWKFVGEDYNLASQSISHSIDSLFEQLTILSERWASNDSKIILMMAVDVTFLPAFPQSLEEQKNMVSLVSSWNNVLRGKAKEWDHGSIYLFDTNHFMLDQIREWQFFAAGMIDANELGKNEDPGWVDVAHACVQTRKKGLFSSETPCENPEKYLFW
ncbi:hypothetical protein T310_5460 [Rasamsonia emersonii CBS 393.64]|uniref:SGNH hydrolase-type esterase domain-containing protein n=1 Tax=Rasamsonia emersonii (strain ATCC 16479 / CBS 393.64 / IMI 116815) TaxID=1408163 RepID=A0A0F4YRN5_RASE3|nr:hypothetical protein T310_5460 [Rasamsonia emersonii CBS 393.64]KKA20516.1 hypothetical protein T310_5460 [Rasamsonia emersonii CBS 393.64]